MRFSYNQLKKLVPQLTLSARQVADLLTAHSYETVLAEEYVVDPLIRVVKIEKVEPHPNADRLRLALVTDGQQAIQVVCGAPNIAVGQLVPYAPPGAKVLDKNGQFFELTVAKIRGVASPGMLNSRRELGLGNDHDGILVLPPETLLGSPLTDLFPPDVKMDADIPYNRSKEGQDALLIAREIAAVTGLSVKEPMLPALHNGKKRTITFRPGRASSFAGIDIPVAQAKSILEKLRFVVDDTGDSWQVIPPLDRQDIVGEHDVIEEVIRMFGLDKIPSRLELTQSQPTLLPPAIRVREKIRSRLVQAGFTESYNYSFADERADRFMARDAEQKLELLNPISPEQSHLRLSLVPGLAANLTNNKAELLKKFSQTEKGLFEIGHVYRPGTGGQVAGVLEEERVAGIYLGTEAVVREKLGDLAQWVTIVSLDAAQLKFQESVVAFECGLAALAEKIPLAEEGALTLAAIQAKQEVPVQFRELNKYPSVFRDLSILIDPDVATENVQEIIERVGGELVADVDLFDIYEPEADSQDRERKKSLAFHIEYQSAEKTLTDDEVARLHNTIVITLQQEIGGQLR